MKVEAITERIRSRFPLLARIRIREGELSAGAEPIPLFLGMLMAVMSAPPSAPLCFVLARRGEIPRLAAVSHSLQRFAEQQGELTKTYGRASFKRGDLVRIHPSKQVYVFQGFDEAAEFIWLRPLNGSERDRWSVRASTLIPRLEVTTLTRPIGRMNTPLAPPTVVPLDVLLGTSTFGNQGLFRNELLVLDSSTDFRRFTQSVSLQTASVLEDWPAVNAMVPFGDVSLAASGGSSLRKWDARSPSGEPLIAITSSPETLANLCTELPPMSKLVVVNGLARVRDLQSFDDISARQHMILFADQDEHEMIEVLGRRGCRFWELTSAELDSGGGDYESAGLIGKVRLWAHNKDRLIVDAVVCENEGLTAVCLQLESLRKAIEETEDGPLAKIARRAWRLLNDASAALSPLLAEERKRYLSYLEVLSNEIRASETWLTPDVVRVLRRVCVDLRSSAADNPDLGVVKGASIARLLDDAASSGATCAVLVRGQNQALELNKSFLQLTGRNGVRAYTPRELKDAVGLNRVLCPSWVGGESMREVLLGAVAPRFTLIGYSFERRWLAQFERRLSQRVVGNTVGLGEKWALVMGENEDGKSWPYDREREEVPVPPPTQLGTSDVFTFEQLLRTARKGSAGAPTQASETFLARYVSFVGEAFAFLSETHGVAVVTSLVSGKGRTGAGLSFKTVADLLPGDLVVFPESGARELIQEKADQLLGMDAPRLRATAHLWKEALASCGLTPSGFLKQAKELGRSRHILTIRNWFAESSQIGPGSTNEDLSEDLTLIALVTDRQVLSSRMPEVIEAIKRLRGAHMSAGVRIRDVLIQRLPEVMGQVEEEGTIVNLGELGSAWIVQVESVAGDSEPRGRGEINRLLWDLG
jgi:hypothetical protein